MSIRDFFGTMFWGLGAVIMLLSGMCSLVAGVITLGDRSIWAIIGIAGGIPFGIGGVLFLLGKWIKPEEKDGPFVEDTPPLAAYDNKPLSRETFEIED